MNIRQQINNHAAPADKPALLWLFSKYHMQSEWNFVSHLKWEKNQAGEFVPVYTPTEEGRILYDHAHPEE